MTTSKGLSEGIEIVPILSSLPHKSEIAIPIPEKKTADIVIEIPDKIEMNSTISIWETFRETGLLFFINQILHAFGWCIAVEKDIHGIVVGAYPQRTSARGFTEEGIDKGYKKVAKYLKENADELFDEIQGE